MKQRLLAGVSASVLALAIAMALPRLAEAQEITGANAANANLLAPGGAVDIISGTVGGQFGAINVNGNTSYNSITLTQSETISVFDSVGAGNVASINTDFVIASSAFGTLVFARSETGGAAGHANMEVFGDLEGLGGARGGDLAISAFDQSNNNASQFHVRGSTYMGALSVRAGDAVAADAGDMSAGFGFGSNNDTFDAFGLTVTGGNGSAAFEGGQAIGTVNVDGANNTAIFGAGGIVITGGQGGVDGNGGLSRLTVIGNATIAGAVTVTGGNEGTNNGSGGSASIDFNDVAGTISFASALTIATGTDTGAIAGIAGNAEAIFASTTVNANGGVVLSEQQNATATLTLDGSSLGGQTFNGTIMAANDGDGVIAVENSSVGVSFASAIGSATARIGTITLTDGDLIEFGGNLFAGAMTTAAGIGNVRFDGDVNATGITPDDATTLDFNGNLTIGADDLTVSQGDATFAGNVSGVNGGVVILGAGHDATFDGTTTQTVDVAIVTSPSGGDIDVNNTSDGGVVFNSTIGDPNGAIFDTITLGADAHATFNDTVAADALVMGADSGVTINNDAAAGTPMMVLRGDQGLTVANGSINLGRDVGGGDIVFELGNTGEDLVVAGATLGGTVVNVSASFLAGTGAGAITLIDDNAALAGTVESNNAPGTGTGELGQFTVTDTALTDFALVTAAGGQDLTITATARTASETADELGISEEDAEALRRAVISTDATGDDEGLDALTEVLNADDDGASAARAAQQVGTQEDTLGGSSEASFRAVGEVFDLITDRLQSSQSGFSGGDLDAAYSLQPRSSRRSVWGQAFGGVANADSDGTFAGWDASYGGLMVGVDSNVTEEFTLGAFGSYSFSSVDGDGAGNSEIEANTFGFGVYAGYSGDSFYLDGFAAYSMSQNDLSRSDILNRTITADFNASQFSIGLAGGVPIEVSSSLVITPNASLSWNHYDADTYTETGSPLAQTVNPDAVSQLTGTIGARIHAVYENFDDDGTMFIPELRVALIGDLMDDDATAMATFTGATAYQVTGTDTDAVGALIGVGLGLDNPDWSAAVSYDADIRNDFMSHTARAEFRWKF